jgi:class 3 adenylate cyclase/tetratricopeptide (TPR) repeat protein
MWGAAMDVGGWLRSLGLGEYEEKFRDNRIDADLLADLTDGDLEKLGLPLGDRKRLLKAIAGLVGSPSATRKFEPAAARPPRPAAAQSPPPLSASPSPIEAERRHLTVMFIDLVDSTALSEKLDPEDMRELIRTYQNTVAGELMRFEGHIAKFMGDGVLAYFGWPKAHEDDAERAVRAGLAVTQAIARVQTSDRISLQARIGIASGIVIVGDLIGDGAAQERSVFGGTPNLAARVQTAAEPGTVLIANNTRQLVGDLFTLREVGSRSFKGIAETTPIFEVLAERSLETRFAARQLGGLTPIVARDQELAFLIERWRQSGRGDAQFVLLSGEAGIGKSRISEALIDVLSDEPHFTIRYQCSPYHTDSALHPAIQQIAHAAGFVENDDPGRCLDRLEALLAKAKDESGDAAPVIAALMGIDGSARYSVLTLSPQQRRNRTLAILLDQLTGLAREKPVLWVIEDAHWIDPTTMELVEAALDRAGGVRLLALITARPTLVSSLASHPLVTRLTLNRLGRDGTRSIIARIAGDKPLPEPLIDEIVAKTDGVPLFVEEMTKAVIESGILREDRDGYRLDEPLSALAIPTTLHDSLMARLDRLKPVKEVAQIASVIGRSFDHRTIAALAPQGERELSEAMQQLVEAELIFRRGTPPEATYLFKHALVRDAAYESLLKAKRLVLHARLLNVLEASGDAAPEIKAQHAEAAGLTERALDYWESAGRQALLRPAYKEAIAHLENALRLCRAMGEGPHWNRRQQGLHLQLGQALIANQGYQARETLQVFEEARSLAEKIGEVGLQIPAVFGLWAGRHIAGTGSRDLAERYTELADAQPDAGPRLIGLRMLGLERFYEGRFEDSLVLVQRGLDIYDPVAHRDLANRFGHDPRASAANYKAWNLWHLGFPDQAAATFEENLRWTRQFKHANTTGLVLCMGTMTNIWLRRAEQVESAAREAIRLAEEMTLALWHAWSRIHLGWALSQRDAALGLAEIEAGLREAALIGAGRYEPFHLGIAADASVRAGRKDEARTHITEAFAALSRGHHEAFAAELYRTRAAVFMHLECGQRRGVAVDLHRALDLAREQKALSPELRAARDLARLLAEKGEKQQAVDTLAPVYDRFTEGSDTRDLVEAAALLSELGA